MRLTAVALLLGLLMTSDAHQARHLARTARLEPGSQAQRRLLGTSPASKPPASSAAAPKPRPAKDWVADIINPTVVIKWATLQGPDRSGDAAATVSLDGRQSRAPWGRTLVSWSWRLSGTTAVSGQQVRLERSGRDVTLRLVPGAYKVRLLVADSSGASASAEEQLHLAVPAWLLPAPKLAAELLQPAAGVPPPAPASVPAPVPAPVPVPTPGELPSQAAATAPAQASPPAEPPVPPLTMPSPSPAPAASSPSPPPVPAGPPKPRPPPSNDYDGSDYAPEVLPQGPLRGAEAQGNAIGD